MTHQPTAFTAADIAWDGDGEAYARRVQVELERERARREALRQLDAEARGVPQIPPFETLTTRLARPLRPIAWRIAEMLPAACRVVLAAAYKGGKTTLIVNLVRSLADGRPFLSRFDVVVTDGTVAVLDFEMSDAQIDTWYRDARIRATDRVLLVALRGRPGTFDILDPDVRADWARRLRAARVTVLIVDCLRPILDALGLDEHKDAGKFLVALDALLADAGISEAIVVHHMGHDGERSRGDSRIRDWPDVEWRLVRQDAEPSSARFLTAYGRDVDVPESQLTYDQTTRTLELAGGSRRDAGNREVLDTVIAAIGAGQLSGRKVKEALKESEYSRQAIEAAIRMGTRKGDLMVESGPHNSRLYRVSVPVSRSVPSVSQYTGEGQCPSVPVPIGHGTLHTHTEAASQDVQCPDAPPPFDPSRAFR